MEVIEKSLNNLPARTGVIYARYSSSAQHTSESIEVQINACLKYALANNISIVQDPFIDRAETGTTTANRKAYLQLLNVAQKPERDFDVILTFSTSRWGRGIESEIDEHLLEKRGVKVIAVSQPFTADDSPESTLVKGILRKLDAYYSMQTSQYTHAYQTANAQNGFKNGGIAPDGYVVSYIPTGKKDRDGKEKLKARLAVDLQPGPNDLTRQPRYKLLESCFLLANEGKALSQISEEIHALGWRNRRADQPISCAAIRTWLTNPVYTGHMIWNRTTFFRRDGKRIYKPNPLSEWVLSSTPSHPAIVSKDIFESVAIGFLRKLGRTRGRPLGATDRQLGNRGKFLLSGLLQCNLCKAPYFAVARLHRKKRSHTYFGCKTKYLYGKARCPNANINMANVEEIILSIIFNVLLSEREMQKFIGALAEYINEPSASPDQAYALLKDKRHLQRQLTYIHRAITEGIKPEIFAVEIQERRALLAKTEKHLMLRKESSSSPQQLICPGKEMAGWAKSIKRAFLTADLGTRKKIAASFIEKIEIRPDKTGKLVWSQMNSSEKTPEPISFTTNFSDQKLGNYRLFLEGDVIKWTS